jgi:hypothetical protein
MRRPNSRFVIERKADRPLPGAARSIRTTWIKIARAGRRSVAEALLIRALIDGGECRLREARS